MPHAPANANPNVRMFMRSASERSTRRVARATADTKASTETFRRLRHLRGGDEAGQFLLRQRAGAEEALVEVAAPVGEQRQLAGALHALDDDLEVELAGQADHRLDDDPVALAADDVGDQPAVDLDHVERQAW